MKRSRIAPACAAQRIKVIAVLKEHQPGAAEADLCRKHGISDATFYKSAAAGSRAEPDRQSVDVIAQRGPG